MTSFHLNKYSLYNVPQVSGKSLRSPHFIANRVKSLIVMFDELLTTFLKCVNSSFIDKVINYHIQKPSSVFASYRYMSSENVALNCRKFAVIKSFCING